MLMPDKHIKFSESLLGLGSYILMALTEPKTVDTLWKEFQEAKKDKLFPAPHSFENLVLAVDMLYAIGAIDEIGETGVLRKCD